MRVLVLAGGTSNEHDVSVRSGQAVAEALKALGHEFDIVDPSAEDFDIDRLALRYDVVFFALHGSGGEDGLLQRHLEDLNKPFVGSGSKASRLCFNKWDYKQFLMEHNLPATTGWVVTTNDIYKEFFMQPYVMKPLEGGSSLDTQIIRTPSERDRGEAAEMINRHNEMLFEPLVEGVEITVGILGDEALPVIEIIPPSGGEFDYENKYNGATQELCPPQHVSGEVQKQAQALALQIHQLTGCRHMSRTDIIVDAKNNLHVLETNTIPGLTSQSLLPKMAAAAGYSMSAMVSKLLNLAVSQ